MPKISMQNVADELGVSKGTVSLVLSGKAKNKRVSDELCERVIKTAKLMNYQPNAIARGLRTGQTKTLAIIVADISNEFFGQLTFYIQERAKQYGYAVLITNTNESNDELKEIVTLLIQRQIDGVIIVPSDNSQEEIRRIIDNKIPIVQLDRYYEEIETCSVVLDNYKASFMATERLVEKGCRRIAMVRHKNNLTVARERLEGYVDTLVKHEIFDESLIKDINYMSEETDIDKAISELYADPVGVDAIFFHSHELFITGVKNMLRIGIRIPEDMQVVCFDKIDAFAIAHFPIMYIEQPIKEMGHKAVDLIINQIKGTQEIEKCRFEATLGEV